MQLFLETVDLLMCSESKSNRCLDGILFASVRDNKFISYKFMRMINLLLAF